MSASGDAGPAPAPGRGADPGAIVAAMRFPGPAEKVARALGLTERRNMFWCWVPNRNFGDWLGPYLFAACTGTAPLFHAGRRRVPLLARSSTLWAAGSILRLIRVPGVARVWGSGILSGSDVFARPREVLAVRGPRSAARLAALGHPATEVFGDPGVLLPEVYAPPAGKTHRLGVIPHYVDIARVNAALAGTPWIRVIDVRQPVERVVDEIAACEATLSSSLHGIIVSHAYGVPSAWWRSVRPLMGDGSKFLDYFESLGETALRRPVAVAPDRPARELLAAAADAPCLDTRPLAAALAAVCPFWPAGPGR